MLHHYCNPLLAVIAVILTQEIISSLGGQGKYVIAAIPDTKVWTGTTIVIHIRICCYNHIVNARVIIEDCKKNQDVK